MESLFRRLLRYFNLESEIEDYEKIHESIETDIIFKGTNLWILIFAIIVASIGLNMNSTAVVIGAMLISPLMGPINGMGYSLATYNLPLFRKAVKNYTFAVSAGLFASTLYFMISPVSAAHSELLARTSPTIYDVLIALFGGMAGIVAIGSRHKGNVIPGVAIATALMPPLCTAGYGLATGQFNFLFGALYLFAINSVFIAFASVVVTQILKFPFRTVVDDEKRRRLNRWITAVILVTLLPSIYFGYRLVQKEQFSENAGRFVDNVSIFEGNYLLKGSIDAKSRRVTLTYGGSTLSQDQEAQIRDKAADFDLGNVQIAIKQGLSFDVLNESRTKSETLTAEVQRLTSLLQSRQSAEDSTAVVGRQLLKEIQPLFPGIKSCAYSETQFFTDSLNTPQRAAIVVFGTTQDTMREQTKQNIRSWLKARLKVESLRVYYE